MKTNGLHQAHADVVKRLKRAEGHLRNVIQTIEADRACLDITQQIHAVEKAIGPVSREARETIQEFKEFSKYL